MLRYVIGDTKPDLSFLLTRDDGVTPLADVASAVFQLKKPSGDIVTKTLTVVVTSTQILATANFAAAELDEGGAMFGEIIVTDSAGSEQHSQDPIPVFVRPEYVEASL